MSVEVATTSAAGLLDLLRELMSLQQELAVVLRRKLDGMRQADTPTIQSATAREAFLLERWAALDAQRHAVLRGVSEEVGLPRGTAPTVSAIAERVEEPLRSRLLVTGQGLRQAMLEVAETNRVLALVTGEMLAHYRAVFTGMTRGVEDPAVYTRHGRITPPGTLRVLDAVG